MSNNFRFKALDKDYFSKYFEMTASELQKIGAYIFQSDECPCYPCRVSLQDAPVGESVLALSFEHQSVDSPYRSAGPIFVRAKAETFEPKINEVPEMLRHRLLSIRGYSKKHLMIEADTILGQEIEGTLLQQFDNNQVQYIHIHNAGPGCFNCSVARE